jgi:hypothetical protein
MDPVPSGRYFRRVADLEGIQLWGSGGCCPARYEEVYDRDITGELAAYI